VVNEDGVVVDPSIEDSSRSEDFNEAALNAVRDWRYEPGEEYKSNVLLTFVYDRKPIYLSKKFFSRNAKVHKSIDNGDLDDAQERIEEIRNNDDLTAVELAYSFIAEGRIAAARGDQVEQLRCFRRAMINQGHWLERKSYLNLLYATIVLEIQQQDFTSALRDYVFLTETKAGRKIAANLEEPIQAIRALVESDSNIAPPYMVANVEMSIKHAVPVRNGADDRIMKTDAQSPAAQPSEQ
jgi:TonB family protein